MESFPVKGGPQLMQSSEDQADLGVAMAMAMAMQPIINDTLSTFNIINLFLPVGRRAARLVECAFRRFPGQAIAS